MEAVVAADGKTILQYGVGLAGENVIELTEAQYQALQSSEPSSATILNPDGSFTFVPFEPLPPPPPSPDIAGLIAALTSSPSIDQATKDALTRALEGT